MLHRVQDQDNHIERRLSTDLALPCKTDRLWMNAMQDLEFGNSINLLRVSEWIYLHTSHCQHYTGVLLEAGLEGSCLHFSLNCYVGGF